MERSESGRSEESARASAIVQSTISHLEAQLERVKRRLDMLPDESFDKDLATAGAALARAVKDLSTEVRQHERHDKKMTFTPEQRFAELIKYLRTLSAEQLERAGAVMDELRKGRAA